MTADTDARVAYANARWFARGLHRMPPLVPLLYDEVWVGADSTTYHEAWMLAGLVVGDDMGIDRR
jgi:hypothetical protein